MNSVNCGYSNHDFQKKGSLIETWIMSPYNGEKEYSKIQLMECSKCGISTYYPEEAFTNGSDTN